MRKIIFVALIVLASCSTTKFTMGMTVDEFTKKNGSAQLVEAKPGGWYVYKAVTHSASGVPRTMFYYFAYNKLVEINQGERKPDIVIDQTIHNQ